MSVAEKAPERSGTSGGPVQYVALAGNPNCGKTTLFNSLTGLRHRVGNYAGVTVERREGRIRGLAAGVQQSILDLPGTYSLAARSPDEAIARDVLLGRFPPAPELVLVVVDASNLVRNLYLASQVMDLGLPVVLCLNMVDVAERVGLEVDAARLEQELGIPVLPMVARKGKGLPELKERLQQAPPAAPARRWELPEPMDREVQSLADLLTREKLCPEQSAWFVALGILSHPGGIGADPLSEHPAIRSVVDAALLRLEAADIDPQSAPVERRYEWIQDVVDRCTQQGEIPVTWTDRLDAVATHRVGGFLLFFALMVLMFQAVFTWSEIPKGWIEMGLGALGTWVGKRLPEGDFNSLIVDGVIAGVGGVVVFMPQILILFFFLGLLEDTGYMARAAFVMDRLMSRVGLHGKSFIPMLSSFGCAIPGIMATRTIEDRKDRMVTIMVAPLMSCSARTPVYALLIACAIPATMKWAGFDARALTVVAMYLLGMTAAMGMAALFKKTLFKGDAPLFLIELPPYKLPGLKSVASQTWERSSEFLKRAGTVILAISILLWAAMKYPGSPKDSSSERLKHSLAGRAGHLMEPLIQPFGMDWKVGIGILGSFAAREVFVSTMAIVYNVEDSDNEDKQSESVLQQMQAEKVPVTGKPRFTPASAMALMVFYVLAMQCVSTMAVVRRETGSWKWPALQWAYMAVLAWVGATVVFHVATWLGFG